MNNVEGSPAVPFTSEQDLVFLVSRLGAVTRSRLADTLASFGLTPRQFAVLKVLGRSDGLSQTELSDRLSIDASSIVHVIDECERTGLATRQRSTRDRRRYAVKVTRHGRSVLADAQSSIDELSAQALKELDPADRDRLRRLLITVAATLEAGIPPSLEEAAVGD